MDARRKEHSWLRVEQEKAQAVGLKRNRKVINIWIIQQKRAFAVRDILVFLGFQYEYLLVFVGIKSENLFVAEITVLHPTL